jgi:hypothetical protein
MFQETCTDADGGSAAAATSSPARAYNHIDCRPNGD